MSLIIMVRTRLTTGGFAVPVISDTAKSLSKQGHRVILLAWSKFTRPGFTHNKWRYRSTLLFDEAHTTKGNRNDYL